MPPTDDKGRFVAIKLGLFVPTACDSGEYESHRQCWKCNEVHPTPPRFTEPAGSDLLLRTLLAKGIGIHFYGDVLLSEDANGKTVKKWRVGVCDAAQALWFHAENAVPAEALLDAAFKALEEK